MTEGPWGLQTLRDGHRMDISQTSLRRYHQRHKIRERELSWKPTQMKKEPDLCDISLRKPVRMRTGTSITYYGYKKAGCGLCWQVSGVTGTEERMGSKNISSGDIYSRLVFQRTYLWREGRYRLLAQRPQKVTLRFFYYNKRNFWERPMKLEG